MKLTNYNNNLNNYNYGTRQPGIEFIAANYVHS